LLQLPAQQKKLWWRMIAAACAASAEAVRGALLLLLLPMLLSNAAYRSAALLHALQLVHGHIYLLLEWFLGERALAWAVTGALHQQALPAAAAAALGVNASTFAGSFV
jgi:hypothetical protein